MKHFVIGRPSASFASARLFRRARPVKPARPRAVAAPFRYDPSTKNYLIEQSRWTWSDDNVPSGPSGYLWLHKGARVGYCPRFFDNAEELFVSLEDEVPWVKREVTINGQVIMQPRRICYMADEPHLTYTYFKTQNWPVPYTPTVKEVKKRLESALSVELNCVLINLYRNQEDYMEWHSDDELLFGNDPTIVSVSFGERRPFDFRKIANTDIRIRYMLGKGDVLIMEGGRLQLDWEHALPAQGKSLGGRINMTFRTITDPEPVTDDEIRQHAQF